jgi:hypothetical protein
MQSSVWHVSVQLPASYDLASYWKYFRSLNTTSQNIPRWLRYKVITLCDRLAHVEHCVQSRNPENEMLQRKIRKEFKIPWSKDADFCKLVEPPVILIDSDDDGLWDNIDDDDDEPIFVGDTSTQVNTSTHKNADKVGVSAGATSLDKDDLLWVNIDDDDDEPNFVGDTSTQVNTSTHKIADKVGVSAGATSTDKSPVKMKAPQPVPNNDISDSKKDTKNRKTIVSNPRSVGDPSNHKIADKVGLSAGATSTNKIPVKMKAPQPVPNSDISDSEKDTKNRKTIVSNPRSVGDPSTHKNADRVGVSAGVTPTDKIPVKVKGPKPVPNSNISDSKTDMTDKIVRKRKRLLKTESSPQKRRALPLKGAKVLCWKSM